MPGDVKKAISEAAKRLIQNKKVKKITVKDIVEECQITRQTFYYHFRDIPDMLEWNLRRETEKFLDKTEELGNLEEEIRYFFVCTINIMKPLKNSLESNYGIEIERILHQNLSEMFHRLIEEKHLYGDYSENEIKLIIRYHTNGIIGIMKEWTSEDTNNLDEIVHTIYKMLNSLNA